MATLQPSFANANAAAYPSPREEPVTSAILFLSLKSMLPPNDVCKFERSNDFDLRIPHVAI